ncbi:MAG TPA: Hsp20/alpha crystallin family protein [Burkholderiales bacterium]|nr:Hsp20/alpha crystallin family protein [Burkholderiales bacterium]
MRERDSFGWMWARALELLEQTERLQRHFFEPGLPQASVPCWEPPVDAIETDGDYWILVALPGVSPQRVRAAIEGDKLVVQGERPMPAKSYPGAIRRLEIPYGRFERRITIPSGHFELREQRFENGCLVIGLRRVA